MIDFEQRKVTGIGIDDLMVLEAMMAEGRGLSGGNARASAED
jgi:hypothetical protein